jgi:hypothetical protein
MQVANSPFEIPLIEPGSPEDIEAGGVIEIPWPANPKL